jgi:hypothetical protein
VVVVMAECVGLEHPTPMSPRAIPTITIRSLLFLMSILRHWLEQSQDTRPLGTLSVGLLKGTSEHKSGYMP